MRERRIPTIFGLLVMSILVFVVAVAIPQVSNLTTKASTDTTPKKILISNIEASSFTVSWVTDSETTGFIKANGRVFMDIRDLKNKETKKYFTHLVTVSDLKTNTEYKFTIGSGSLVYYSSSSKTNKGCEDPLSAATSGNEFVLKTPPDTTVPGSDIASGLILLSNQKEAATGAILCLSMEGFFPLTTLVEDESNGVNFFLNIAPIRRIENYSIGGYESLGQRESLVILYRSEEQTTGICETGKDKPMSPAIVLGESGFECGKETKTDTQTSVPTQTVPTSTPTPISNGSTGNPSTSIDTPDLFGGVNDTLPTFRGKGKPGQVIQIVVESDQLLSGGIRVKPDGSWSWTPPENLKPGEHTVTLTLIDDNGNKQTITRKFTVIGGSPILPITNGTPSATIAPGVTNYPTPTATPAKVRPGNKDPGDETPLILFLSTGSLLLGLSFIFYFRKS